MIKTYTEYITEKLGVSKDTEVLSDFLLDFLSEAEPGKKYIFVRPGANVKPEETGGKEDFEKELPDKTKGLFGIVLRAVGVEKPEKTEIINQLPQLDKNLYKVIVSYKQPMRGMENIVAFFDPSRSRFTKNGYILYFTFHKRPERDKIWKHLVYHEIHHGLQFMSTGKKKTLSDARQIKVGFLRTIIRHPIFQQFIQYLYYTIRNEQGAYVMELYGKLKHRKGIKNIEDLKKYFKERKIYEYKIARELAYCDLKKLFSLKGKNPLTGEVVELTNREMLREFFTLLKKIGNDLKKIDNKQDFVKQISHEIALKKSFKPSDKELISDKELDAMIKGYQEHFNRTGKKVIKKMDKMYAALYDYYTDKFEKKEKSIKEAYYSDLTTHTYSDYRGYPKVLNVGWLDKGQPYETGDVPDTFLDRLKKADTIHRHKGFHDCPFCGKSSSSTIIAVEGHHKTYFAPDMIFHYIKKHHYKPPQEFIDAVMQIPYGEAPQYKKSSNYKGKGIRKLDDFDW